MPGEDEIHTYYVYSVYLYITVTSVSFLSQSVSSLKIKLYSKIVLVQKYFPR